MHHRELVGLDFYVVHPEEAGLGLPRNVFLMRLVGGRFGVAWTYHICVDHRLDFIFEKVVVCLGFTPKTLMLQ